MSKKIITEIETKNLLRENGDMGWNSEIDVEELKRSIIFAERTFPISVYDFKLNIRQWEDMTVSISISGKKDRIETDAEYKMRDEIAVIFRVKEKTDDGRTRDEVTKHLK